MMQRYNESMVTDLNQIEEERKVDLKTKKKTNKKKKNKQKKHVKTDKK